MSSSEEDDILLAAASLIVMKYKMKKNNKKKRRLWMTQFKRNRIDYSGSHILRELAIDGIGSFKNFTRLTPEMFTKLLNLVKPIIEKKDTTFRKAIPPKERLAMTLRYLATGDSYTSIAYLFKVSKQIVSLIIPSVCEAIAQVLKEYIKLPNTKEEWEAVSKEYETKWNFPNCVGSIDALY